MPGDPSTASISRPPDPSFDAVLLIAFGGPLCMDDVRPFLANVLSGRPVPPERVEAVVRNYARIGGRSPLHDLTLQQAERLAAVLRAEGPELPVYVGMRNWVPYFRDTVARMAADGVRRAVGVIMSSLQSDASWDRYVRDVDDARAAVGDSAPHVAYAAEWHGHPLFIEALADNLSATLSTLGAERARAASVVFTAHSLPLSMAEPAPYVAQLRETASLVARRAAASGWTLAYQSRSGNPRDPWLEPDILDAVRTLARSGSRDLVVVPVGFVCDHVEVLYDLDIQARQVATELGIAFHRVPTVNAQPTFIRMLADVARRTIASARRSEGLPQ